MSKLIVTNEHGAIVKDISLNDKEALSIAEVVTNPVSRETRLHSMQDYKDKIDDLMLGIGEDSPGQSQACFERIAAYAIGAIQKLNE